MRVLNKTNGLLILAGSHFQKSGADTVKHPTKITLSVGINHVDREEFNTVSRSYVDALIAEQKLEILPEQLKQAPKKPK